MSEAEAAKRYLGPLQELAKAIAQRMSQPTGKERAVKPAASKANARKPDRSRTPHNPI